MWLQLSIRRFKRIDWVFISVIITVLMYWRDLHHPINTRQPLWFLKTLKTPDEYMKTIMILVYILILRQLKPIRRQLCWTTRIFLLLLKILLLSTLCSCIKKTIECTSEQRLIWYRNCGVYLSLFIYMWMNYKISVHNEVISWYPMSL